MLTFHVSMEVSVTQRVLESECNAETSDPAKMTKKSAAREQAVRPLLFVGDLVKAHASGYELEKRAGIVGKPCVHFWDTLDACVQTGYICARVHDNLSEFSIFRIGCCPELECPQEASINLCPRRIVVIHDQV